MYEPLEELADFEEIGLEVKAKAFADRYKDIGKVPGITTSDAMIARSLKEIDVVKKETKM